VLWQELGKNEIIEEWETEGIDTWFFGGYEKKEKVAEVKNTFIKNFQNFTSIVEVDEKMMSKLHVYKGDSFEELKKNTAHMNKNIEVIKKNILSGSVSTPLLLSKNGEIETVGGRTRLAVSRILKITPRATIIYYDKLTKYFKEIRKREYTEQGFGILCFESKRKRLEIYRKMSEKRVFEIRNDGEEWPSLSFLEKKDLLKDLERYLFEDFSEVRRVAASEKSEDFLIENEEMVIENQEDSYFMGISR